MGPGAPRITDVPGLSHVPWQGCCAWVLFIAVQCSLSAEILADRKRRNLDDLARYVKGVIFLPFFAGCWLNQPATLTIDSRNRAGRANGAPAYENHSSLRSDCSFPAPPFANRETENAIISRPNTMGTHSGSGANNLNTPYPRIRMPPVKLSHCIGRLMILSPLSRKNPYGGAF